MSLADQISIVLTDFGATAPDEIKRPINSANEYIQKNFQHEKSIQVGAKLPEFNLRNAVNTDVSSNELLFQGPLLISFYRGEWCPFCNLTLAALQKHLEEFQAKGVTLVAISPELPDQSLSTTEKHSLKFPVLSDKGNQYARQLGLVWSQPDSMRATLTKLGADLPKRNGDDSFDIPIPAAILVDRTGLVRNTYIEPDWTKRVEPTELLKWVDAL